MFKALQRLSFIVVALLFGVSLAVGSVSAQELRAVTIHKAECPTGYSGDDPFSDCHGNPVAGVSFEWNIFEPAAPNFVTTDANGVAVIETTATGFYIAEQVQSDLAGYSVFCSTDDGATSVPITYLSDRVGISFQIGTLSGISEVVCDWYNIPVASDEGTTGGSDVPTTLPSTGVDASGGQPGLPLWLAIVAVGLGGLALGVRRTVR